MTKRSSQGAETRLRIIGAAADLFHKQGVQATSPDDIIEVSGTGKGQERASSVTTSKARKGWYMKCCRRIWRQLGPATLRSSMTLNPGRTWSAGSVLTWNCKEAFA